MPGPGPGHRDRAEHAGRHLRPVHAGRPALDRSQGGLGIGLTLVRAWSSCTAARSRPAATGRAAAASSSSACRSLRPPRPRPSPAPVVVDHEDAQGGRHPGRGGVGGRLCGPRGAAQRGQADGEGAALARRRRSRASTVPPCSSTSALDQRQADPQPAPRPAPAPATCTNMSKISAQHARAGCRRRVADRTATAPLEFGGEARSAPGLGVLGGVVEQVGERPGRAASGRPRARSAPRASANSSLWPAASISGRLASTALSDHVGQRRPAPRAARSCRG